MGDRIMARRKPAVPASAESPPREATGTKKVKTTQPKVAATKATRSKSVPPPRPEKPAPKGVARPKSTPSRPGGTSDIRAAIARRLREIRQELFGDQGGPELARRLNLPARTWYNYETGVSVPAQVLLAFIEQTGVDPWWVLTGAGPKYRRSDKP
jgi:hypothetical protein